MKAIHNFIAIAILAAVAICYAGISDDPYEPIEMDVEPLEAEIEKVSTPYPISIYQCEIAERKKIVEITPEIEIKVKDTDVSEAEMIAKVMRSEAGNQDEKGKRLVCDVILNRVDSASFPDSIKDVIIQPNQFAKGIVCTEDDLRIVKEEMMNRTDSEIVYFRTKKYHTYGIPAYQHGDHYFSKEESDGNNDEGRDVKDMGTSEVNEQGGGGDCSGGNAD